MVFNLRVSIVLLKAIDTREDDTNDLKRSYSVKISIDGTLLLLLVTELVCHAYAYIRLDRVE